MPLKSKIDPELPPSQLFSQMISNSHSTNFPFFQSHINKDYIAQRKNILNILHKITTKMGFKSQIFFLSVKYLDIIFSSKKNYNIKLNLHTAALTCLILSAKFGEVDPYVPQLIYFIKIYYHIIGYKSRNHISLRDLKIAEVDILKILNYKLNYYTIYDINSFLFVHGVLKTQQIKEITGEKNDGINSHKFKKILEKIYKKSRYYLDIVINCTKLCFNYDDLFLSIYIMKKSIEEILFNEKKIILSDDENEFYLKQNNYFKDIMKSMYNIDYEKNEQYQRLISDEEVIKIFGKNKYEIKGENIENSEDNNLKKIELNKAKFSSTISDELYNRLSGRKILDNNKYELKFDIDILKNFYKKKAEKYKSLSLKNNSENKTLHNFSITTKNKKSNLAIDTYTSKNKLNNYEYQSMEKREIRPKIKYSKYTFTGVNLDINMSKVSNKNTNASVEFKTKNTTINPYDRTSQKQRNNYSLNFKGKTSYFNKENSALYQKKLVSQNINDNNTISSFMEEIKQPNITYDIISTKPKEIKREYSIEYKKKEFNNNLQKINFLHKISLKKNKTNINDIGPKIIEKNILNNSIVNNKGIERDSANNIMFYKTINDFKKLGELNKTKDIGINNSSKNNSIEKRVFRNINHYKNINNNINANSTAIKNTQLDKDIVLQKNRISYLFNKQNTSLNSTLKEINLSLAKNMDKNINVLQTIANEKSSDFFKTQKNYYKIKQDKNQEELIKNQQDKKFKKNIGNNPQKKISSTIVINNNINFNIGNRNVNGDVIKYNNNNNVYKKNKIMDKKQKNYLNVNKRNKISELNQTFYKSHLYNKTLDVDFIKKRF